MNWRDKLIHFMEEHKKPEWRYAHSYRIYHMAKYLDVENKCDEEILFAVAMLHDIGAYPEYAQDGVDHPVTSRKFAEQFLHEIEFPSFKIKVTLEAIGKHMFSSEVGESVEAIVVRDADILDFLGIIGVARSFLKTQHDIKSGYEELKTLSQMLPDLTVTEKARLIANERKKEIEVFLEGLRSETFGGRFM